MSASSVCQRTSWQTQAHWWLRCAPYPASPFPIVPPPFLSFHSSTSSLSSLTTLPSSLFSPHSPFHSLFTTPFPSSPLSFPHCPPSTPPTAFLPLLPTPLPSLPLLPHTSPSREAGACWRSAGAGPTGAGCPRPG